MSNSYTPKKKKTNISNEMFKAELQVTHLKEARRHGPTRHAFRGRHVAHHRTGSSSGALWSETRTGPLSHIWYQVIENDQMMKTASNI